MAPGIARLQGNTIRGWLAGMSANRIHHRMDETGKMAHQHLEISGQFEHESSESVIYDGGIFAFLVFKARS